MSSLARSIRRAIARRTGEKPPQRNNGQSLNKGRGNFKGARCFDYEMPWRKHGDFATYAAVMMVHFRHPTKKRTPGRVCRGLFVQSAVLQKTNTGQVMLA